MPKRKALDPADANTSKPAASKKTKASGATPTNTAHQETIKRRSSRWSTVSGSKNLDADHYGRIAKDPERMFTFMCLCDPLRKRNEDDEGDEDEDDEDEDNDEDNDKDDNAVPCDGGKKCACGKEAASRPDHKAVLTRAGIGRYQYASDLMSLRDPDSLGMYTYNDHAAYGALEVVENMMLDFDEAFAAKRWLEAWSVLEGLGIFLLKGDGNTMMRADDGERIARTARQIARMPLALLSAVEAAGLLSADSGPKIPNAGYVIRIYREVGEAFREMSLLQPDGGDDSDDSSEFTFVADELDTYLLSLAHRYGLTVPGQNVSPTQNNTAALPAVTADQDAWGWTKSFTAFRKIEPEIGGDSQDMSTWTSAKRKSHSFDKKDPFPRDIVKKLKAGLVLIPG